MPDLSSTQLTEVEKSAAYNYWLIAKDGTFGVHNPPYTKELLLESIQVLKRLQKN